MLNINKEHCHVPTKNLIEAMEEPCLSVIITTYKREISMVMRAIESVRQQTYQNIEIILVDDNPDGSKYSESLKEAISSQKDVTYIKQDGNKGACAARNLGIKNSKGEFIGFLDDDDTWKPQKAKRQIECFQNADDSVGMVYCLGEVIDTNFDPPKVTDYYTSVFFRSEVTYIDLLRCDMIGSTSQAVVRKSCFEKVGGFKEELPARQDYEMWIRISKHYKILGLNEKLFNYYQHEQIQITKSFEKAYKGICLVYQYYKSDFDKDYLAKIHILERHMLAVKGHKLVLYWYYRIYRLFIKSINKFKH